MPNDTFHNVEEQPVLEDLPSILGPRLHHNFDKIYNEIATHGYTPNIEWDKGAEVWFFRYYKDQDKIFDVYVSEQYFYALIILSSEDFVKVARHRDMTEATSKLIHKFPENQSLHNRRVEATLDNMNEQEGFFDLLPILNKVLLDEPDSPEGD